SDDTSNIEFNEDSFMENNDSQSLIEIMKNPPIKKTSFEEFDPDKAFLLSFLPDFKKMKDNQKLDFKILFIFHSSVTPTLHPISSHSQPPLNSLSPTDYENINMHHTGLFLREITSSQLFLFYSSLNKLHFCRYASKKGRQNALEARADTNKISPLIIHAEDLDKLVEQFEHQQLLTPSRSSDHHFYGNLASRNKNCRCECFQLQIFIFIIHRFRVTTSRSVTKNSIPSFDGSLLEWRSFRDIYVSLVHENTGIGNAERFHYLLSCLSGDALAVVKSIPLSADNYILAWDALADRFDNKRLLASTHVDKLFDFKPITQQSLQAMTAFVYTFKKKCRDNQSTGCQRSCEFFIIPHGFAGS
ncbi:Uncharacterized protein FWK35_00020034, partial [Aphis craccivora]